jgi:hypothetical protein
MTLQLNKAKNKITKKVNLDEWKSTEKKYKHWNLMSQLYIHSK